jgi:hypothetical protein
MLKKKIWPNFPRIIEVFTQKIVTKPSKIRVWDPGSEIRDPEKTYSGSRIQGSKRHRIPDPGSGSATLHTGILGVGIRGYLLHDVARNRNHFH